MQPPNVWLALDGLEAAVERRPDAGSGPGDDRASCMRWGDRSQLASDLDVAVARSRALETTNREIARRLEVAIDTIKSVLEANDR